MYLDYAEYKKICADSTITEQQFNAFENRAETDIDTLTFNRITATGLDSLIDYQRERVLRSLAWQVNFINDNFELLDSSLSAYSISGVSMSFDKSKIVTLNGVTTTNQVYNALMQTGLCYRGIR